MVFKDFAIFEESCENGPQKLPKEPPGGQNGAQERLGSAKRGPRGAKRSPRRRQERAKSDPRAAQEATKRSQKGHHVRFCSWDGLREASGSHFGLIFKPPGRLSGRIQGASCVQSRFCSAPLEEEGEDGDDYSEADSAADAVGVEHQRLAYIVESGSGEIGRDAGSTM